MGIISPSNQVEPKEWINISEFLAGALSSNEGDTANHLLAKAQGIQELIIYLTKYIPLDELSGVEAELHFIELLDKLTRQKEILETLAGKTSIHEVQSAGKSFARKTKHPVGMRG